MQMWWHGVVDIGAYTLMFQILAHLITVTICNANHILMPHIVNDLRRDCGFGYEWMVNDIVVGHSAFKPACVGVLCVRQLG